MNEPITYTETEVRSYLPNGWSLDWDGGRWDAKERSWSTTVSDNVDFDWRIAVKSDEADSVGRIEALRQAFDRTFRGRFTKSTRGLGIWRKS